MRNRGIRMLAIMAGFAGILLAQTPPSKEIARFQQELTKARYVAQTGVVEVFDFDQRACLGDIWSALWPNPNSPYFAVIMKPVPGQAANTNRNTFRIRDDEAIVAIGVTPPPVTYFAFGFHMIKGVLATGTDVMWIPIGDPINIKTARLIGGTPFNQPFALVVTGNERTQNEVHAMLRASGLQPVMNDQVIPSALFRLGLDANSDEFAFAMRTAVVQPGSEDAFNDYVASPPIRVFRVRPESTSGNETVPVYPPAPLPVAPLRVSGTGRTELDLNPTLQLLRQRIIDAHPGYNWQDLRVDSPFSQPYPGLQRQLVTNPPAQIGVAGATSDAQYFFSPNFTLPDGAFVVAYGAHHRATGKATYSSVSVYADPVVTVGLTTQQSPVLQGTARDYIPEQPNADMFYAWTFTRPGGPIGPHVTTLPDATADYCAKWGTTKYIDLRTISVGFRTYMEPATNVRPSEPELLIDRLLLFTK